MNKNELKEIPVSFYRNMRSTTSELMNIGRVLDGIAGDYYESQVKRIRHFKEEGKIEEANELKQNLHAVTFSATFKSRRLSSLYTEYNSLLVIDIDKLSTKEVWRVKDCLELIPFVACYWMSPSGNGWKGLVVLDYQNKPKSIDVVDMHHWAFLKLEEYFKKTYSIILDSSGKDITRLCFMSWCPDLRVKDQFDRFVIDLGEMIAENIIIKSSANRILMQSSGEPIRWNIIDGQKQYDRKGNSHDRRLLENIYKYLNAKNLSITSTYEDWVKVAFAIAHTFHSVYGRRMFMKFCELDRDSHDESKSERLIYDAYTTPEKKCDFSTIIYLAKGKGFVR